MKKILITTAALSLMLLACDGDTSAKLSGDEITTNQESSSIPRGTVIANIGACGLNSSSYGKAYMTNTDNGGFQVVIPDMHVNDEWHNDELPAERVGDTLHVGEEREYGISLNWICYAHHTFDISAEDSDIKYFKYFNQVFEVVPGPAPEKVPDVFIDESTNDTIVQKSDSTSDKTVIANSGPCSLNHNGDWHTAYLANNEKVGYQIVIPDASAIGYYTNKELYAERVGDTLHVWENGTIAILDWICYVYYTFNIPAEDADIKYFKYFERVFKVVPGPAPEKSPDTLSILAPRLGADGDTVPYLGPDGNLLPEALDTLYRICTISPSAEGIYDSNCVTIPSDIHEVTSSNSTARSSSSVSAKSSASVAKVGSTHQIITDAQNQCTANTDTTAARYAYRYVSTERTGFTLENLKLTYGIVADTLDVDVSGDTVFVKAVFDFTNAQRMYCQSQIDFAVENNPAFSHARFVSFLGVSENPILLEIYDMDVITVEEVTRQYAKDITVECKNDRQTLNKPTLQAVTLLPDFDTTSKQPLAGRIVGDDGFDKIVINELDVGCSVNNVELVVSASEDTLYVKSSNEMYATNCVCPSRIDFKIPQNFNFSNTSVLVFDHFEPMPLVTGTPINN